MEQENKAIVRRLVEEVWNRGSLEAVAEIIADDYVRHGDQPGTPPGPQAYRDTVATFRASFPDLHMIVEDLMADGDKVVGRWVVRGSQRGQLMGIEPTGRCVEFGGIFVVRLAEGRVVEEWEESDELGLMRQLGAMPALVVS